MQAILILLFQCIKFLTQYNFPGFNNSINIGDNKTNQYAKEKMLTNLAAFIANFRL